MLLLIFILGISISFLIFSYLWVDKALILTLSAGHAVVSNLEAAVSFGNVNREILAVIYVFLIVIFFILQCILILSTNRYSKKLLYFALLLTTLIFSFSYNFASHDLFTYLFSAKMLWVYHLNPYIVSPEYLVPTDFSVSFLRNIQNTYPYGVVSLIYSLFPVVIFSGDRILLNIFSIRLLNAILFYATGFFIYKTFRDERIFGWWFFNPILLLELLVNGHNDLLLICIFIISLILFYRKKIFLGIGVLLAASLTKSSVFVYEALIFLTGVTALILNQKYRQTFFKLGLFGLLAFLQTTNISVQVWYYTWVYMFVPFAKLKTTSLILLSFLGVLLLLNYYSFIKTSGWGGGSLPGMKIWGSVLILTVAVIQFDLLRRFSGLMRR